MVKCFLLTVNWVESDELYPLCIYSTPSGLMLTNLFENGKSNIKKYSPERASYHNEGHRPSLIKKGPQTTNPGLNRDSLFLSGFKIYLFTCGGIVLVYL